MQRLESDYDIRRIAAGMGLLPDFGPQPSVVMLLRQLTDMATEAQHTLPMKSLVVDPFMNFRPVKGSDTWWDLATDAPWWGNNAKASSSRAQVVPDAVVFRGFEVADGQINNAMAVGGNELVAYDDDFAVQQILNNLHPAGGTESLDVEMLEDDGGHVTETGHAVPGSDNNSLFLFDSEMMDVLEESSFPTQDGSFSVNNNVQELALSSTPVPIKKRKLTKAKTPIVDDEVRRSNRNKKVVVADDIQLDNEPRRRKGEKKKTILFSSVEDLKKAIVLGNLHEVVETAEAQVQAFEGDSAIEADAIPIHMLMDIGTEFCGVPLE